MAMSPFTHPTGGMSRDPVSYLKASDGPRQLRRPCRTHSLMVFLIQPAGFLVCSKYDDIVSKPQRLEPGLCSLVPSARSSLGCASARSL